MSGIRVLWRWLDEYFEYALIVVLYSYFLIVVVLEVVLRYGFHSSIAFSEETARHAFIWLAWIAAGLAAKHRLHISLGVIQDRLPLRGQFALSFVYNAIFILFCLYGLKYVWPVITTMHEHGTLTMVARHPMYLIFLAVPLGYGLMVLRVTQNVIVDIDDFRAGRPLRRGAALF